MTINVGNLEERGEVTLSALTPRVGRELTATLGDPDGGVRSETWSWSSASTRNGSFTPISGALSANYTPVRADAGRFLRAAVAYTDDHGSGKSAFQTAVNAAAPNPPPTFANPSVTFTVNENATTGAVGTVTATDPENEAITYSVGGAGATAFNEDFSFGSTSGAITVKTGATIDHESRPSYALTVTATDPSEGTGTIAVTIKVTNVEEMGRLRLSSSRPEVGTRLATALADPDGRISNQRWEWASSSTRGGPFASISGAVSASYTPRMANENQYLRVTVTYTGGHGPGKSLTSTTANAVLPEPANRQPTFASGSYDLTVRSAVTADAVVGTVSAADPERDALTYTVTGTDAASFDPGGDFALDDGSGRITVRESASLTLGRSYGVTVEVSDRKDEDGNADSAIDAVALVTITVANPTTVVIAGGGGPSGPAPSDVQFEWNVKRDIEALAEGHGFATGLWGDGETLWITENGSGADDSIYAYDIETGERVEDLEFELDDTNHAPRGVWSDGETIWVSDSGREKLFAHNLESGERLEDRDIEFARRNADARGIWGDGETIWVLDGRRDSLFAYDLATGDLLGEYELAGTNGDPHGLWSDGISVWVSDHGAKRLFVYRLPERPEARATGDADGTPAADEVVEGTPPVDEEAEPVELERVRSEEFATLTRAGNNSPRGLWSDGFVMYVVDQSDSRVYTFNMPDALDASLESLSLSGVDIGEFAAARTAYDGVIEEDVTVTTIEAKAAQRDATVAIDPADANEVVDGHQLAAEVDRQVTLTVTSLDQLRTRAYRVTLSEELALDAGWSAFTWLGADGVALADALRGGGDLADDISTRVSALYHWDEEAGVWLVYVPGLEDVPGLNTITRFRSGQTYWIALTEPATWTAPALSAAAEAAGQDGPPPRPAAFAGTVTDPRGEVAEGLAVEAYVGDTRCNAGEPVATYRVVEDGREVTRYYASVAHADQLAGCAAAGADVTFLVGDRAVVETGAWDNTAYPWQTLDLTLARETATEETVTIDVAVWRRNEDPFNALADLYISTRAPGESWDTHDDDGALAMTLYTSPRSGTSSGRRSDLTPIEVALQ